jgi:hypothetical protein
VQKVFRFLGLVAIFAFMVGCCAKKMPPFQIKRDIPISPESVLFIGAVNGVTGESISGSAIIVEKNENWSWAVSAGHVCYPEVADNFIMWTDIWMSMAFNFHGEYEPIFMVALDQVNDVCIFRVPMTNLPAVPIAEKMPNIGEKVFLGAYPLGVYNPGHVPFFEGYYAGILEGRASYTIPVTGGASGGGVVNKDGELVGIISLAIEGFENITLVPKLENVQTLLDVAKKNPERFSIIR